MTLWILSLVKIRCQNWRFELARHFFSEEACGKDAILAFENMFDTGKSVKGGWIRFSSILAGGMDWG